MKIKKMNKSIWISLLGRVADLLVKNLSDYQSLLTDRLAMIHQSITTLVKDLNSALCYEKVKSYLNELDNNCTASYAAVRGIVFSLRKIADRNKSVTYANALDNVIKIMKRYKFVCRRDYKSQSFYLDSFIADMSEQGMAPDIALIPGLEDALTTLINDQNVFVAELKDYKNRWNKRPESATSIAKKLYSVINFQLIPYMNASMQADPVNFTDLGREFAVIIRDANRLVYTHSKKYKLAHPDVEVTPVGPDAEIEQPDKGGDGQTTDVDKPSTEPGSQPGSGSNPDDDESRPMV